MSFLSADSRPVQSLTAVFLAWKFYLLAIAFGTTLGTDYDTSTSLFFERMYGRDAHVPALAGRLTRWDALYYMRSSRDGYVYEQDWAFGAGLPIAVQGVQKLLLLLPSPLSPLGLDAEAVVEPMVAIIFAHVSHLVAVLALHRLTIEVFNDRKLAFVVSVLHILSPAGLFLSAPYPESPFACLTFVGNLLFAKSLNGSQHGLGRRLMVVGAGVLFGLATAFRSNGLSSGLLFLVDTVTCLVALKRGPSWPGLLNTAAPLIGGLCVAAGAMVPQAMAWNRYCNAGEHGGPRPWCSRLVPSIYTFVQEEYWNVGFLKYWTLNQLPLFLLAAPVLAILLISGFETLRQPHKGFSLMGPGSSERHRAFVRTLAVSQALVATLAITNYHVQIISRLSSGYPVWYWWSASCLLDGKRERWGWVFVIFMTMYGSIQGALFASFLPPA